MKSPKFILAAIVMLLSVTSFSQADTTKKDTGTHNQDTTKMKNPALTEEISNVQGRQATEKNDAITTDGANKNATATTTPDATAIKDSLSAAPKPNFGRYYIPVLGIYSAAATATDNKSITITGDESNPGKVWIEGLTSSKFYALLKSVPGTYKIPAQKQDDITVAEGTVVYDENSKQINLCLGCGFNDQAPVVTDASATIETDAEHAKMKKNKHTNKTTKKVTIISFTGTKSDNATVSILQK